MSTDDCGSDAEAVPAANDAGRSHEEPGENIERVQFETHARNPAATRLPGGYWNEDSLPVTDWEVPDQRVVLPEHPSSRACEGSRPALLDTRIRAAVFGNRVLFQDEDERWYSWTMGELQGRYNVITVFGGSDRRLLAKRLRGLVVTVIRSG